MTKYIEILQIEDLSGFTKPNTNAGAGKYYEIFTGAGEGGVGTVTDVSVVSANGFGGSVANASSSPDITITTSINGVIKGNGTAISAASAGTDYYAPGSTDVAVADGGTGASTAANARTNLGAVNVAGDTMTGALIASDHGSAATDEVVNVCYGTGAPPAANTTTEGTIFIQYTA
jgi:hypothetical protein